MGAVEILAVVFLFVVAFSLRFAAAYLVGSGFFRDGSKKKAAGVAFIGPIAGVLIGLIPLVGILSPLIIFAVTYYLIKNLYDTGAGIAIGATFLVEVVVAGLVFALVLLFGMMGVNPL